MYSNYVRLTWAFTCVNMNITLNFNQRWHNSTDFSNSVAAEYLNNIIPNIVEMMNHLLLCQD